MRRLLVLLLLLLPLPVLGQTGYVTGTALDGVGNTVAGATITVCPQGSPGIPCSPVIASTVSNGQGAFSVGVPLGTYTVTVFRTGIVSSSSTVVVAASNITVGNSVTYNGAVTFNQTATFNGSLTVSGTGTIGSLNGRCEIDGVKYTTLASAFADASCSVIDDRGFKSGGTFASTITWPARAITLYLAQTNTGAAPAYRGPASGPMFLMNVSLTSGSSIIGGGITANNQPQYGNGTVLQSNASNTSPLVQILSGSSSTIQGVTLNNLVFDGNNSATDCLQLDAVRNSIFLHNTYNNCTAYGVHMIVTNTNANQGNQFNTFYGIFGGGSPQLLFLDGNATATSSTTLNWFHDIAASFSSSTLPGIEIKQGDGNTFDIKQLFPTAGSYTGDCVKLDAPVGGSVEGGLFNYFVDFHVACGTGSVGGNTLHAAANTYGNRIDRFDGIENQPLPVVDSGAQLDYNLDRANTIDIMQWNANKFVGWAPVGANSPDIGFLRCGGNRINVVTSYSCGNAAAGILQVGTLGVNGSSSGTATIGATATGSMLTLPLNNFPNNTAALTADWTCGTGGTVSSCVAATIIGSGGGVPLTFTLPSFSTSYTLECDGVVGQATAATANQWNLLTATNGATNVTANYSMATAATASAFGAVTDQASTTTTFQIAPSWTLGGTGTKMPFHIWAKIEGASASGTVVSLQLVAPTVGDLVTIYRGAACRVF